MINMIEFCLEDNFHKLLNMYDKEDIYDRYDLVLTLSPPSYVWLILALGK